MIFIGTASPVLLNMTMIMTVWKGSQLGHSEEEDHRGKDQQRSLLCKVWGIRDDWYFVSRIWDFKISFGDSTWDKNQKITNTRIQKYKTDSNTVS